MPEARPVRQRVDDSAGDIPSLVQLGLADPAPEPSCEGLFLEPDIATDDAPPLCLGRGAGRFAVSDRRTRPSSNGRLMNCRYKERSYGVVRLAPFIKGFINR